jgi:hypothetical protein
VILPEETSQRKAPQYQWQAAAMQELMPAKALMQRLQVAAMFIIPVAPETFLLQRQAAATFINSNSLSPDIKAKATENILSLLLLEYICIITVYTKQVALCC